jgi:hypothetical protein
MMRTILFLVALALFNQEASAQVAGKDLPFLKVYQEEIPYFQELITGGQYAAPSARIKGDPYFVTRQFEAGTLRINGISYPQVPLIYDIFRDQLVTFHPIFSQKILIKPEKIDGFEWSDGKLFRFFPGNESFLHHGNGIYEVLGEGKATALAKRYKTTRSLRDISRYDAEYVAKKDYFLWKEGTFFPIKKSSQAFAALQLNAKVLKKELKSKGLQFKKAPEAFLNYLVANSESN